jgi:hypothetical protein
MRQRILQVRANNFGILIERRRKRRRRRRRRRAAVRARMREITKFHSSVNPRRGKNSLGAFVRPITFTGERKISGIFKGKLLRNGGG